MKPRAIIGQKFGRLLVLDDAGFAEYASRRMRRVRCLCDCGNETTVLASKVTSGHTRSCGCLAAEIAKVASRTHGGARTPEHNIWRLIKGRCLNPRNDAYKNYGARGITICDEWLDSFGAFLAHIGPRPSPLYTIDRIDNNRGYEPGNVRWATRTQQNRNSRTAVRVTFRGQTRPLNDWCEALGIKRSRIKHLAATRQISSVEAFAIAAQERGLS